MSGQLCVGILRQLARIAVIVVPLPNTATVNMIRLANLRGLEPQNK